MLPKHEADRAAFEESDGPGDVLRRNETDRLAAWVHTGGLGHWAIMRTVIPPVVWENW